MADFSIIIEFIDFAKVFANQILGYLGNFVSFAIQVGIIIIIVAIIGVAFRIITFVFSGRRNL